MSAFSISLRSFPPRSFGQKDIEIFKHPSFFVPSLHHGMSSEFVDEMLPAIADSLESWYRHRQTSPSKLVMIAGGRSDDSTYLADVNIFNPYTQEWTPAAPLLHSRSGFGMATVGNSIYAVGGLGNSGNLGSVEIYDAQRNLWQPGPEMLCPRMGLGVTALNGTIFTVGGWDGDQISREAEMLDQRQREWIPLPSMKYNRLFCGLAAVNGHLYAAGGEYEGEILNSVEVYDPRAHRWTTAQPMHLEHNLAGATVFCDRIVVVGGTYENGTGIPYAEIITDKGPSFLPRMSQPRGGLGVVDVDGALFAFGGRNDDAYLSCIEYWEFGSTQWDMPQVEMPKKNAYFGITLLP